MNKELFYSTIKINIIFLLLSCFSLTKADNSSSLPIDPKVTIGKLNNGFTYYIRQNSEPQNRVTIYLVNKVGSILETDEEQGLAHFIEHMNFNGTSHFPKNELVNYLQKSGVKFGSDLNAFTGFDQTVYQLPLPTDDPVLLKNGFQIMRDWAHEALLDSADIDSERGVILEEKRLRANAQQRMQQSYFPVLLNNSRYVQRIPIGTEEVLKGFKRNTLRGFYKKWYRPDLQAIIVVGDINVSETEKTIQQLFSDLKNPADAPKREEYDIRLLNKNQFFKETDKEISLPSIQIFSKYLSSATQTKEDYTTFITKEILNTVIGERFSDLSKQPTSGFVYAKAGLTSILKNLDAFSTSLTARSENIEKAFKNVWTEVERYKKYGITAQEFDRAKQSYINRLQSTYNEKDKTPSVNFVNEYMRNFTEGEAIPGLEFEYKMCMEIVQNIDVNTVNKAILKYINDENRDILVVGPEKDKDLLPSEELIEKWISEVRNSEISNIKSETQNKILIGTPIQKGSIVKEKHDAKLNVTEYLLSNGVKVVLKPTTFKNDEIKINASSPGGTSLYSDEDYESASRAAECVMNGGLGDMSLAQLQKYLSAKKIMISPYISERFEGLNGVSSPQEIETALQLVYLYFTKPRKDFQVYTNELERLKVSLAARSNDPANVFADTLAAVMNNYHLRRTFPTVERIKKIDPERAFSIFCERFKNAADFTFTFVGNINTDSIKPLIEKYLGSLPSASEKEKPKSIDVQHPVGKNKKLIYKGVEKKSTVKIVYSGKYTYNEKENTNLDALADLMTIKLLQRIREQESGVYGISATAQRFKFPSPYYTISIGFGCAPENTERLIHSIEEVISQMKNELPLQEDVQKVVNEDLRAMELKVNTNSFWMNCLVTAEQMNEKPETMLNHSDEIRKVTAKTLKNTANKYLKGDNITTFILYPSSN